jgi:YebC/PmpR family DNA-binding regulatory protein
MSGHNKWSQIKHKKAKEDSKKGKAFTKLIKEITMSAKAGGGDPANNAHLRLLIEKGKEINMPAENTKRAIQRGTGEIAGANYEEIRYEGYGPHGVAIIVDTLSDNRNRTVATLRRVFSSHGGNLGDSGVVSWMFNQRGVIRTKKQYLEDTLIELLLDYTIDDITNEDDSSVIICAPKELDAVRQQLIKNKIEVESAELEWVAKDTIDLPDDQAEQVMALLTELDDHDDVQHVYTNLG